MKEGRSLTDLAQEIDRQAKAKQDYIVATPRMEISPTHQSEGRMMLSIPETPAPKPLRDLALMQIAERTGVPVKYARRMQEEAPDLLATNLNRWFHDKPERRMVRTLDGEVRAFLSDRYARIDNFDVASYVLPVLKDVPGLVIRSTEITENRLYIKATSSAITREVKSKRVGDLAEAGVMISNSEVGLGAVSVTPFMLFLVCTNGMTREGGKRWNHIGRRAEENDSVVLGDDTRAADDKAQLLVIRDTLKAALDEAVFDRYIAKLEGTTMNMIEGDVAKAVEVLGNHLGFSEAEQSCILRHLAGGGDLSQYGLANAVTRLAEDAADYDRATELETLGARVIDLTRDQWSPIAKAA
jgi:hypothetical protein